jgi:ABC-2 type transport system ATP-binding protein
MVVTFGNTLHVSGTDEAALERTVAEYASRPDLEWRRAEPSLEDVFIMLMSEAPDNFVRDAPRAAGRAKLRTP